jgi:hypothetical protein
MSDMVESSSEIDRQAQAQELVLFEMSGYPSGHIHLARYILSPTAEAVQIEVHTRAAELYAELIAAAPDIWNQRAQGIADAEDAMKGADDE